MNWKKQAQKKIRKLPNYPYLTKNSAELEYVLGYTGTNGYLLVLSPDEFLFYTDGRYYESYRKHFPDEIVLIEGARIYEQIQESLEKRKLSKVYFNPEFFSYSEVLSLRKAISPIKTSQDEKSFFAARKIKTGLDIEWIKEGVALTEEGLSYIVASLKEGMSEKEAAAELEYYLKLKGADDLSFPVMVLFGEKTALPHGVPGDEKLKRNDVVLIDMGIRYHHFCTDMTRTFLFGDKGPEGFEETYNYLLKAQKAAIQQIEPGIDASIIDLKLRETLAKRDLEQYYIHSLGHGVGVEIHEKPYLSYLKKKERLRKGNLFTIEPGVYIPGKYGIRIEDMVYIRKNSQVEVLTSFPKELLKVTR